MTTSVTELGRELIAARQEIDRCVAEWVLKLAEFDDSCAWAQDGFANCASWLSDRCELSRAAAFEKLKVSHELSRRPLVRHAFERGLAYSKVRLLVQLVGADHERDVTFVQHATIDSVRVLEERVNNWNYFHTQDAKPGDLDDHYGLRRERGALGGFGRLVIEAPDEMLDRVMAVLHAYQDHLYFNDKPVDESTQWTDPQPDAPAPRSSGAKLADGFFDLIEEIAFAEPKKIDPYRAAVGVTIAYEDLIHQTGTGWTDQGSRLTPARVQQLLCDAGVMRLLIKGQSEILDFGTEQRLFNRALRRAIRFRHGHRCAVRGCDRRITQIHHLKWVEHGGETTIENGIPLCSYHHHLVHDKGWQVEWNPQTGLVRFLGPQGQVLLTEARFGRLVA